MNYMKQVAQMLGVELGEVFKVDELPYLYNLTDEGMMLSRNTKIKWEPSIHIGELLNGSYNIIKLPKPILDDEEKEYLKNLIKHFRNYIKYIERETEDFYNGEQLESINIWMEKGDIGNFTIIPIVETSLTFEGMEDERQYSLEELGL